MLAYRILDVELTVDDSGVRAAYLKKLQCYPPENFPGEYQTIRKAFEKIETEQKRLEYFLFGIDDEFEIEEYQHLNYPMDTNITLEKWDRLCRIYQENK